MNNIQQRLRLEIPFIHYWMNTSKTTKPTEISGFFSHQDLSVIISNNSHFSTIKH